MRIEWDLRTSVMDKRLEEMNLNPCFVPSGLVATYLRMCPNIETSVGTSHTAKVVLPH